MLTRTGIELALGLCLVACGASNAASGPGGSGAAFTPITDVERFLPLEPNTVYAFETSVENTGEKGALMMAVDRPHAGMAVLTVGGKGQRLEIDKQGIRLANGGWLLKAPLEPGAHFRGQFGEVIVRSIDRQIDVPAGHFTGCVETIEDSPTVQKRVTTVFCPKVGIVLLDAEGTIGDDYGHERAALRSYGPRVDINEMK